MAGKRTGARTAWNRYRNSGGKYRNVKATSADGREFDSTKERNRYEELLLMQKAGMIYGLETQKKYILIPAQREPDTVGARGGTHKGKVIERETVYIADFTYYTKEGDLIVEDVKSPATRTPQYKIKKKLMLYVHGIRIKEV